jgi:hypothetical protein
MVAAYLHGERFGDSFLKHEGTGWDAGVSFPDHPSFGQPRISRKRALRMVDICVAGEEAAALHDRRRARAIPGEFMGDMWEIREALWACNENPSPRELKALVRERRPIVRELLRKSWPAVVAVATALLEAGTLTSRQTRSIIRRELGDQLDKAA